MRGAEQGEAEMGMECHAHPWNHIGTWHSSVAFPVGHFPNLSWQWRLSSRSTDPQTTRGWGMAPSGLQGSHVQAHATIGDLKLQGCSDRLPRLLRQCPACQGLPHRQPYAVNGEE